MPYYDFKCNTCGIIIIKKVPRKDCNKVTCTKCGDILHIIIHPIPFVFKEKL